MTTKYLWSGATGAANGSDFTNAYTTLASAFSGMAAGDFLKIADDHSESVSASTTWTAPGTFASPNMLLCVNRGTGNLSAGGLITTSTSAVTLTFNGSFYVYGLKAQTYSGLSNSYISVAQAAANWQKWVNSFFDFRATGSSASFRIGTTGNNIPGHVQLMDCTFSSASVNNDFVLGRGTILEIGNLILAGAASPGSLLNGQTAPSGGLVLLRDSDLSSLGSNPIINAASCPFPIKVANCRMGSAWSAITGTQIMDSEYEFLNCDSGDTNNIYRKYVNDSSVLTDTGVYLTTGGSATTHNGATVPQSLSVTPGSSAARFNPVYTSWQSVFNDTTGSRTLAVKTAYDAGAGPTVLKDYELFLEVESLNTSGYPQGSVSTTQPDMLNAGTALTDTAEAWTGTSGWTAKKTHTLSKTVTIAEQGAIRWRVGVTYNSSISAVYVDNKATLS